MNILRPGDGHWWTQVRFLDSVENDVITIRSTTQLLGENFLIELTVTTVISILVSWS